MNKFKVGDEVVGVESAWKRHGYTLGYSNPLGEVGIIEKASTVNSLMAFKYLVKWPSGATNGYREDDLELSHSNLENE